MSQVGHVNFEMSRCNTKIFHWINSWRTNQHWEERVLFQSTFDVLFEISYFYSINDLFQQSIIVALSKKPSLPHITLTLTVPIYPFLFKEIKPYLRKTNKTHRQSFHILQFRISASTSGMHKQFSANSIKQNINGKLPRYPKKKKFPRSPLQKLRNILWTLPRWYFSKQERIKEQNPTRSVGVLCCLLSLYTLDRVVAVVSINKAHCATELSYIF